MAYPGNFLKFSFGGKLAGGEEWTNSINLARTGLASEIDLQDVEAVFNDWLNDFTANLESFFNTVGRWLANTTTLEWSKLAIIGPDGRYAGPPVSRPVGPIVGRSGSTMMPNQIALALSMQSDAWGARGKNGRIYLAGVAMPVEGDGRIGTTVRDDIMTAFAQFLDGLATSGDLVGFNNVAPAIASAVGEGAFNTVARVRVGRVLDTIRSRRTNLDEEYAAIDTNF